MHRFQIGSIDLPMPFEPSNSVLTTLVLNNINQIRDWAEETYGTGNYKVEKHYDAAPHMDRYYLTVYSDADAVMFKMRWL